MSLKLSKVGTTVGRIEAKDADSAPLYYRLVSPVVSPSVTCLLETVINTGTVQSAARFKKYFLLPAPPALPFLRKNLG